MRAIVAEEFSGYQNLKLRDMPKPGKTVLAPAIGGSVGKAVTQLARALGASHAISTTTGHAKAKKLGSKHKEKSKWQ
jgi:NADPH:quinone reductase-like Zn-dependent oxidoreductase